jgi:hypothetical protein
MKPPARVYATYVTDDGRVIGPQWFYLDGSRFRSYGAFNGAIRPQGLTVAVNKWNDLDAVVVITRAKRDIETNARSTKVCTADFVFANHGSVCILTPISDAGKAWADAHLPEDAGRWGGGTVIEPRYVGDILAGIAADNLEVK